jgi:hypothetical protein
MRMSHLFLELLVLDTDARSFEDAPASGSLTLCPVATPNRARS